MNARLSRGARAGLALMLIALLANHAWAGEAQSVAANPVIEARMMDIATELRCLVCQNQTVADSHADLAVDLRQQIRDQLAAGKTDEQVRQYMTDRYGDFVLYRPPFNALTALLWVGPGLLLLGSLAGLIALLRRRSRLADDAFEPDTEEDSTPTPAA
jgi:cytochrome c-type biogenesis protein CcmH